MVEGEDVGHGTGFLSLRGAGCAAAQGSTVIQGSTMILMAPLAGSLNVARADG